MKETNKRYLDNKASINAAAAVYQKTAKGREVHRKANAKYKKKYKTLICTKERKQRRLQPMPYMLHQAKCKAKKRGMSFNLTAGDLIMPLLCPVLGIPLKIGDGKATPNSPSLDRIDNTKGYIKGNVIIVSNKVNMTKNDATIEELGKIYEFYKKLLC